MKKMILVFLALLFLATNCSDPCDDVNCNNGVCVEGTCDCDEGWIGNACNEARVPTQIRVERIELLGVPAFSTSGVPFDATSPPDVFLNFDIGEVISISSIKENCADENVNFIYETPTSFNPINVSSNIKVIVYDKDPIGQEKMAEATFPMQLYDEGPDELRHRSILSNNVDDVIIEVSYIY